MISCGGNHLLGENLVRTGADLNFSRGAVGLPLLVERHHDYGGTVAAHQARLPQELRFAFFQRNGVHHALALQAF